MKNFKNEEDTSMRPAERLNFLAINSRPPLKLPRGARMVA